MLALLSLAVVFFSCSAGVSADNHATFPECSVLKNENGVFRFYLPFVRVKDIDGKVTHEYWSVILALNTPSMTATVADITGPFSDQEVSDADCTLNMQDYTLEIPYLVFDGQAYACVFTINSDLSLTLDLSSIKYADSANGLCPEESSEEGSIDVTTLTETDDDILGISRTATAPYDDAISSGARVVNLDAMETFFVLWIPDSYENMSTRRVMVLAHGHTGNAYRELDQELEFAEEYGYAIVAIQWWTGEAEEMYSGEQFYEFMNVALQYMAWKYNTQLDKCAYRGWSMGSGISYEVTYLDRINGTNYLKLTISHDGGMMPDPTQMSVGEEFVTNLYNGVYGYDAFSGTHFYLYAGQKGQAEYMRNTAQVITSFGGTVEQLIEDVDAGHDGFYRHPQYHEEALQIFFRLAP